MNTTVLNAILFTIPHTIKTITSQARTLIYIRSKIISNTQTPTYTPVSNSYCHIPQHLVKKYWMTKKIYKSLKALNPTSRWHIKVHANAQPSTYKDHAERHQSTSPHSSHPTIRKPNSTSTSSHNTNTSCRLNSKSLCNPRRWSTKRIRPHGKHRRSMSRTQTWTR